MQILLIDKAKFTFMKVVGKLLSFENYTLS